MADEAPQNVRVPKENRIVEHAPILMKVLEVILAIFAIGLIVDPLNSFQRIFNKTRFKLDDAAFIYIAVAGYIVINTLFIISHVLGDRVPKRTMLLFSSVGALLHIVAGSLIIHNWRKMTGPYHTYNNEIYPSKQYMDMLISSGVFTFFIVLAFIGEILITLKFSSKDSL